MRSHVNLIVFLLLSMFCIAGCGQKGPLFLPGNTNEVSTSIQQQQVDSEDEEEEDETPVTRN